MLYRTILITESSFDPVTDQQALDHLREDVSKQQQVKLLLRAAAKSVEVELISVILTQAVFEMQMDDWPADGLAIAKCPLVSIASVKYDDVANAEQTLPSSNYFADTASLPGRLRWSSSSNLPGLYDKPNVVRIRFTAGYGAAGATDAGQSAVPSPLKAVVLQRLGQLYEFRSVEVAGTTISKSESFDRLIAPYRIPI